MTHRIHYAIGRGQSAACGRKVVPNWVTHDPVEVTCPVCKLTDDYRAAIRQPRLFPGP